MRCYHLYAWCYVIFGGLQMYFSSNYGIAIDGTCCVRTGSSSSWIVIIPILVYNSFAIFSVIYIIHFLNSGLPVQISTRVQFVRRYVACIVVFVAMWLFPALQNLLPTLAGGNPRPVVRKLATISLSLQGAALALVRFTEPAVFHACKQFFSSPCPRRFTPKARVQNGLVEPLLQGLTDENGQSESSVDVRSLSAASAWAEEEEKERERDRQRSTVETDPQLMVLRLQSSRTIELCHCMLTAICDVMGSSFNRCDPQSIRLNDGEYFNEDLYTEVYSKRITVSLKDSPWHQQGNTASADRKINFTVFAPSVFLHIRTLHGCLRSTVLESLCPRLNGSAIESAGRSQGRSGSFVFRAHDGVYMIKTLTEREKDVLIEELLPTYHKHLARNPNSLLTQFHGCFALEMRNMRRVNFVLMKSCFAGAKDVADVYDLKGSRKARNVLADSAVKPPPGTVMKDVDFKDRLGKLEIDDVVACTLLCQISKDVTMLSKLNIMDYSLLVGISPTVPSFFVERHAASINGVGVEPIHTRRHTHSSSDVSMSSHLGRSTTTTVTTTSSDDALAAGGHEYCCAECFQLHVTLPHGTCVVPSKDCRIAYYLGLIDLLQIYDSKKKLEHVTKTIRYLNADQISAVNSAQYAKRFLSELAVILDQSPPADLSPLSPHMKPSLSVASISTMMDDEGGA
eukprot:GILJ01007691.1.p1 GENE.GILJ01007691.1~~GILJ01007691.1.p1  ORF type:complete len:784 (+),score=85.11 GILJ01007691.1:308-2353(+)